MTSVLAGTSSDPDPQAGPVAVPNPGHGLGSCDSTNCDSESDCDSESEGTFDDEKAQSILDDFMVALPLVHCRMLAVVPMESI